MERAYGRRSQLPLVVVCGTGTISRGAGVVLGVAGAGTNRVAGARAAVGGVGVVFADVGAGFGNVFALATATVPAIVKNDATLSPPSNHRVAGAA
ncbi:MAG: hypothetical protein ABWZ15_15670 [Acidimicrobiia bacterium]